MVEFTQDALLAAVLGFQGELAVSSRVDAEEDEDECAGPVEEAAGCYSYEGGAGKLWTWRDGVLLVSGEKGMDWLGLAYKYV